MSRPAWGYFIYYRLDPAAASSIPWDSLFAEVAERTGVEGRLYGPAPDGRTWMEVYEPVAEPRREEFEAVLAEAVRLSGLTDWLAAGERRHVERFPRADRAG
ncbi:DUF4936 family protein [Thiohalorhabdus methylotrophus]|uniref:DUF4936 family protein n=1 Tax=Thiohalorhabdus methylotrophus TaxID=3242694 RepID=A0ABV4TYQ9_9GAMM